MHFPKVIVMRCLEKDPMHRPSARTVQTALKAILDGDQVTLEQAQHDPSATSALIEGEEELGDEEAGFGSVSPLRSSGTQLHWCDQAKLRPSLLQPKPRVCL